MEIIRRVKREIDLFGKTPGERAILREVANQKVSSSKDLSREFRYSTAKPFFEEFRQKNNRSTIFSWDYGFTIFFMGLYGPDTMGLLAKDGLAEFGFDFDVRPKSTPLPDYLIELAEKEGWKK